MGSNTLVQAFAVALCMFSFLDATMSPTMCSSIYDFNVKDTDGQDVYLEKFKGNVVLIVNIASQCGLAPSQYKVMKELREKYHDKGLRIVAFPSNQFRNQMPEADGAEIMNHLNEFGMEFDLVMAKGAVNGESTIPLFQYLKHKKSGMWPLGDEIKWNFTKFLVDRNGQPVHRFASTTKDITKEIEQLL